MGGIQVLVSGLGHLGTFDSIISFSGGPMSGFTSKVLDNGLKRSPQTDKTLREFIVTAGASGEIAYQNTVDFQHELTSLGFKDQFYARPSTAEPVAGHTFLQYLQKNMPCG